MTIRPLYARLLIKRFEAKEMTSGGIVIPDQAKQKVNRGQVIAMGKGAQNKHGDYMGMDFNVGDVVMFEEFAGKEVEADGSKLLLLEESAILAVIEIDLDEDVTEEVLEAIDAFKEAQSVGS